MEDRVILKGRKWSVVRWTQVVAGVTCALVTLVMVAPIPPLSLKVLGHRAAGDFLFRAYLDVIWFTVKLCDLLGISQGYAWLWILAVVLNTILGIIIGTVLGWILRLLSRERKPKSTRPL